MDSLQTWRNTSHHAITVISNYSLCTLVYDQCCLVSEYSFMSCSYCTNCWYKRAYDCAQLQYITKHRIVAISSRLILPACVPHCYIRNTVTKKSSGPLAPTISDWCSIPRTKKQSQQLVALINRFWRKKTYRTTCCLLSTRHLMTSLTSTHTTNLLQCEHCRFFYV